MKKRVYDMAGVIGGSVKVTLNGQKIEINSFSDYTDFYLKNVEGEVVKVYISFYLVDRGLLINTLAIFILPSTGCGGREERRRRE